MTIAVSVKVHDGIVFASDSAGTISLNGRVINVYNNLNKIFNLHKKAPIGAMMCGSANIGRSSVSTLVKDLRKRFTDGHEDDFGSWALNPKCFTMEFVAYKLRQFFNENLRNVGMEGAEGFDLEFFVGGYSVPGEYSEMWKVEWRNGLSLDPVCARTCEDTGADWGGMAESLHRLVDGFSPGLAPILATLGIPPPQLNNFLTALRTALSPNFETAAMPIQDAIDLAEFYAQTAIHYTKFQPGPAKSVGGPIEIAAVTKHEGFTWIQRKHYFKMEYNAGKELQ